MKPAIDVKYGDVLVGEAQGQSKVLGGVARSSVMHGCVVIDTEHGSLYVDAEEEMVVES